MRCPVGLPTLSLRGQPLAFPARSQANRADRWQLPDFQATHFVSCDTPPGPLKEGGTLEVRQSPPMCGEKWGHPG